MDDPALIAQLLDDLEPHFDAYQEVWLRHPAFGFNLRIDAIVIPREPLAEELPFELLGIEIKSDSPSLGYRVHAFKQCIDYRQCVLNDQRLPQRRGMWLPCVALYRGKRAEHYGGGPDGELVRLAGKFNVGVLDHHPYNGLELRISDEPIWSARSGITQKAALWPTARLLGNSSRRAP